MRNLESSDIIHNKHSNDFYMANENYKHQALPKAPEIDDFGTKDDKGNHNSDTKRAY